MYTGGTLTFKRQYTKRSFAKKKKKNKVIIKVSWLFITILFPSLVATLKCYIDIFKDQDIFQPILVQFRFLFP